MATACSLLLPCFTSVAMFSEITFFDLPFFSGIFFTIPQFTIFGFAYELFSIIIVNSAYTMPIFEITPMSYTVKWHGITSYIIMYFLRDSYYFLKMNFTNATRIRNAIHQNPKQKNRIILMNTSRQPFTFAYHSVQYLQSDDSSTTEPFSDQSNHFCMENATHT